MRYSFVAASSTADWPLPVVGVLAEGDGQIKFLAHSVYPDAQAEWDAILQEADQRDFDPVEVFDYHVERANGVTRSLSRPVASRRRDIDAVLTDAVAKIELPSL